MPCGCDAIVFRNSSVEGLYIFQDQALQPLIRNYLQLNKNKR
jgi:hypothetical protein